MREVFVFFGCYCLSGIVMHHLLVSDEGMFVGRGIPLGVDKKASSFAMDSVVYTSMSRAMIMPCSLMEKHIAMGGVDLSRVVGEQ